MRNRLLVTSTREADWGGIKIMNILANTQPHHSHPEKQKIIESQQSQIEILYPVGGIITGRDCNFKKVKSGKSSGAANFVLAVMLI